MHLNQLYGIFGRRQDLIETVNVYNRDIPKYAATRIIKNIIEINDKVSTLLLLNNVNSDLIKELNIYFENSIVNSFVDVKSNVAIAAAVTSYARIHMIPFKIRDGVCYTDTDSIFTTEKLNLVGNEIGLMKDELDGNIIQEAYFLDIKKYGYWFKDTSNVIIEKSVFAGVTRNILAFKEIIDIFNGVTIVKYIPVRFFKSFKDLNITIKPSKI
jgi:hypothetical protein